MAFSKLKPYIYLFILSGLVLILLLIIRRIFPDTIMPGTIFPLLSGFTLISLIVLLMFLSGVRKGPEKSVLLTLAAISLKMLLSFVLALVFFIGLKNREMASVLLFFILYLIFTFFVVFTFLSILKKSELKEKAL